MNKTELIRFTAEKTGVSQKDADKIISAAIDTIVEELASGGKVQLVGFGAFEIKERAARIGRNPQTKQAIEIPASRTPVFKAGKRLKEAVV
ncbi:MAG: HU family DNA-binding protein [Clostridiales bacterium]|jgi:DNA-binding protein HU-beta|nr:HU family DNA-binding protein [Clostridiales bacterium]